MYIIAKHGQKKPQCEIYRNGQKIVQLLIFKMLYVFFQAFIQMHSFEPIFNFNSHKVQGVLYVTCPSLNTCRTLPLLALMPLSQPVGPLHKSTGDPMSKFQEGNLRSVLQFRLCLYILIYLFVVAFPKRMLVCPTTSTDQSLLVGNTRSTFI